MGEGRGPKRDFGGKKDFGDGRGGSGGRSGGSDFGGPREMHKAICAECGEECDIPFKPSGDRPVYCRECFQKHKKPRF